MVFRQNFSVSILIALEFALLEVCPRYEAYHMQKWTIPSKFSEFILDTKRMI